MYKMSDEIKGSLKGTLAIQWSPVYSTLQKQFNKLFFSVYDYSFNKMLSLTDNQKLIKIKN